MEKPFLEAVKITLGDRYSDNMDTIYRITIKFILDSVIKSSTPTANNSVSWERNFYFYFAYHVLNVLHKICESGNWSDRNKSVESCVCAPLCEDVAYQTIKEDTCCEVDHNCWRIAWFHVFYIPVEISFAAEYCGKNECCVW